MTTAQPPLPGSYEGILARARNAFRHGDLPNAISLYGRLVERLAHLGERFWARRPDLRGLYVEAAREYAEVLSFEGRYAEGIQVLEPMIPSYPEQSSTLRQRVAILRNARGDAEQGLADLQALADEHPEEVWTWLVLSNEARIEGRLATAQVAVERALQAANQQDDGKLMGEVHFQRFQLLKALGRVDEALSAWEAAVAAHPEAAESVDEVYIFLTDVGRYSEALRYAARDGNALRAGFQRGLIAYRTGRGSDARKEWRAVADLNPLEFEAGWDCWIEAALRLGDPEPALERLQGLLERRASQRLLMLAGIGWAMRGDGDLAAALFQQAINVSRRRRERKTKLDSADWRLLDSLVADTGVKATLRPYFAVVETVWGQPDPETQILRPSG